MRLTPVRPCWSVTVLSTSTVWPGERALARYVLVMTGGSLVCVTVIVKTVSVYRPSESVERTRMLYEFSISASNTTAVSSVLPTIVKEALPVLPVPLTRV